METNIFKQISCLDHELKEYMADGVELHKMLNLTQFQILLYLFKNENEDVCQKDLQKEISRRHRSRPVWILWRIRVWSIVRPVRVTAGRTTSV